MTDQVESDEMPDQSYFGPSLPLPGVLGGDDGSAPDDPADDPGATQGGTVFAGIESVQEVPASPFGDPVVPPDPFTDSDGNQWPTRDPFAGTPPVDF